MSNIEFLIDENVLGLDRYLDTFDIKYRKVGDPDCPEKGADDLIVAKFAKKENIWRRNWTKFWSSAHPKRH